MFRAVSSIAKGIGRNAPKIIKGAKPLIGKVFKGIKSGAGRAFKGASRLADKTVKGVKAGITRVRNFIRGGPAPTPATPAPAPPVGRVLRPTAQPLTPGAYDSSIPVFTQRGTGIPVKPSVANAGFNYRPRPGTFIGRTMTKAERLAQAKTNLKLKGGKAKRLSKK